MAGAGSTGDSPVTIVYCRGCQHAWADGGDIAILNTGLPEDDPAADCTCTCTDDLDPRYEDWVTDPDAADIPEGAWE